MNFVNSALFLSILDVGVIVLVMVGAWVGSKIGVVSTLFNTLAGLAGSWIASRYYLSALPLFHSVFLAYFSVFAVVAMSFVIAGVFASQWLENYFLGISDRVVGALLGIFLSLTLAAVGLIPTLMNDAARARSILRGSAFAPYLVRLTQKYFILTSQSLWINIDPYLESDQVRRMRERLESAR